MLNEWQAQYNKGENLFSDGAAQSLWEICKKFKCQNVANEQDSRQLIEQTLSTLKSELIPPQPTSIESMFAILQFTCETFGSNCRFAEIAPNHTLHQVVLANFDSYLPPEYTVNLWVNKIRGNYRQRVRPIEARIDMLAEDLTNNPEKLHAAELMIGMIDDLSLQVESHADFARFRDLGYEISNSKTIRNRIDHQQSTYREHDVESEDSFSTVYINNHPKSTAQTLLFMMINLRGAVNEILHNPQAHQTQQRQFAI